MSIRENMVQELDENLILMKKNEIQIIITKRFGITMEEFAEYYAESFAKQWNKFLNNDCPEKTDWTILCNQIYYYIDRHYMSGIGRSEETKSKVNNILTK